MDQWKHAHGDSAERTTAIHLTNNHCNSDNNSHFGVHFGVLCNM